MRSTRGTLRPQEETADKRGGAEKVVQKSDGKVAGLQVLSDQGLHRLRTGLDCKELSGEGGCGGERTAKEGGAREESNLKWDL